MEIKLNEPWITNKVRCQNGYAYIDIAYWNSEKQRADHKREYIGKFDGQTFTPNENFMRLKAEHQLKLASNEFATKTDEYCQRKFYGATYLLDQISEKTGIAVDLHKCFGPLACLIMSMAYYLVLEEGQAMYRFPKWGLTHCHPFGGDIPSQRSSELFGVIMEDAKMNYFKYQAGRHGIKEYLAFDTTSISSYSTLIKQVKYGKNKEGDSLPQINLALLYGEDSMIPVYYRKLAGNITDVSTIQNLIKDIEYLELEKCKLVLDRGFYSEKNINDLMKHHYKFLIGAKTSLVIVKKRLDTIRADFVTRFNYNSELQLYVMSFTDEWDYKEAKPRSGKVITDKRRIYIHYYYNDQKATDDKIRFNAMLDRLEYNLIEGHPESSDEKLYNKYFNINKTPAGKTTYSFNEDEIREAEKNYGYFVLMTNDIKDPVAALKIYRLKDLIEKSFGNLKERLSMRRMSVASEENLEGKLFVQFVALQLTSYIKKQMDANKLFSKYTIQSLLDELDIIEYYQKPGKKHHLSEITEKQRKLYEAMDVPVPT